jgi:hypothetical protein
MPTVNVPARFQKSVGAAWADVIKVSIYRAAEMMRVKLCEAAHITANPLAFSLGCPVDKDGNLVQENPIPIVAQA